MNDWPYGMPVNRCEDCDLRFVHPQNGGECPRCGSRKISVAS